MTNLELNAKSDLLLTLPVRAINALRSEGIYTHEQLLDYYYANGEVGFLKIPNMGKKSCDEVWIILKTLIKVKVGNTGRKLVIDSCVDCPNLVQHNPKNPTTEGRVPTCLKATKLEHGVPCRKSSISVNGKSRYITLMGIPDWCPLEVVS